MLKLVASKQSLEVFQTKREKVLSVPQKQNFLSPAENIYMFSCEPLHMYQKKATKPTQPQHKIVPS